MNAPPPASGGVPPAGDPLKSTLSLDFWREQEGPLSDEGSEAAIDPASVRVLRRYAQWAAIFAAVVGSVVLLGWFLGIQELKSILPSLPAMKANTAAGLVLAGLALWLLHPARNHVVARAAGAGIALGPLLIGALTLAEYLGWNIHIGELLIRDDTNAIATAAPGWPSPITALALLLVGASLLMVRYERPGGWRPSQYIAMAAAAISALGFLGYLYGAALVRVSPMYSSMALHTAITLIVLSTGLLGVHPHQGPMRVLTSGGPGGTLARWLIPTVIVFAVILGWLRLQAQRASLIDTEFGLVTMVTLLSIFVAVMAAFAARKIDLVDRERSRIAKTLEATGHRLALALHAGEIGVWDWHIRSNVINWDEQMHALYGTAPGTPVDYTTWSSAVLPGDLAEAEETLQRTIKAKSTSDNHFRINHPRKGVRYITASEGVVVDDSGAVVRVVGVNRDVTAQKELEASLRASEERLRLAFEYSAVGSAILSLTGRWISVNNALCHMVGYSQAELLATDFQSITHADDLDADLALVKQLLAGEIPSYQMEKRYLHKDGHVVWIRLSAALVRSFDGEPVNFIVHIEDITERKRAEERATSARAELEAFSYSVAHDLRAPLRAINGFSQILQMSSVAKADDDAKDCLRQICDSSKHMSQLIDDLLSLAQVGRTELRREDVDLSELTRRIAEQLRKSAPGRDVEFVIQQDVHAHGDGRLLAVVMENLLGNAWKYTGKREQARVEFGTTRVGTQLRYFVRDNGDGFDMAYASNLFKPFKRLHSAVEFEGTGIGLASVLRVIQRHGGSVQADGVVGAGATFSFTLG